MARFIEYKNQRIDFNYIENLIQHKTPERLDLEFKANDYVLQDLKKRFGCEVSAMANSGGGLVIYGIKNGKNSDGIDIAEDKDLFNLTQDRINLQSFTDKLKARIQPIILELKTDFITKDNEPEKGFFVASVVDSILSPHMFVHQPPRNKENSNKYYMRNEQGDSIPMNHYEVQLRMRAQTVSPIRLILKYYSINADRLEFCFEITNIGRAIIEGLLIRAWYYPQQVAAAIHSSYWARGNIRDSKVTYVERREEKIFYPNSLEQIYTLNIHDFHKSDFKDCDNLVFFIELYGKGMVTFYGSIEFTPVKGARGRQLKISELEKSKYDEYLEEWKKEITITEMLGAGKKEN